MSAHSVRVGREQVERDVTGPSLVEPHIHVDRAFSLSITGENRTGLLSEAIDRFVASFGRMKSETLLPGAVRTLRMLADSGVSHVRAHTAVGGALSFQAWEAVELAASQVPEVKLSQVAMPVDPNLDHADVQEFVREAARRGAVAVGGAPWLADHPNRATEAAVALASELGLGLDLHVDESDDATIDTIPELAASVASAGLGGRAVAAHCCSMAVRSPAIVRAEAEALADSGVAVVVCPVTNLSLQGRYTGRRGLAPVQVLRDAGVTVGVGSDNLRDVVVSLGDADPIRMAWLLGLTAHLTAESDLKWLVRVVFENNRRICGVSDAELGTIRLRAGSLEEAVAIVAPRSAVSHPREPFDQ